MRSQSVAERSGLVSSVRRRMCGRGGVADVVGTTSLRDCKVNKKTSNVCEECRVVFWLILFERRRRVEVSGAGRDQEVAKGTWAGRRVQDGV